MGFKTKLTCFCTCIYSISVLWLVTMFTFIIDSSLAIELWLQHGEVRTWALMTLRCTVCTQEGQWVRWSMHVSLDLGMRVCIWLSVLTWMSEHISILHRTGAQLRGSSQRVWRTHIVSFKDVCVLVLVSFTCMSEWIYMCAVMHKCVRANTCVRAFTGLWGIFFACACPCECLHREMWSRARLTHPSACAAAGSETRSGPCLSKHTSRHMQHRSSGQEIPDRGEETRINR